MSRPKKKLGSLPQPEPSPLRGWAKIFGFPKDCRSYGKYVKRSSPDKEFLLLFEPGFEYAMMRSQYQFRLLDAGKMVVQAFQGLVSPMQLAWWSPDSRIVAIPVDDRYGGLLLFDVRRRRYSLVHFDAYQETIKVTSTGVQIGVERREFEAVFGTEFQPPGDISFRFATLRWLPAPETGGWKLREAYRNAPAAEWQPPPSKEMKAYARAHGIQLIRRKS